jgi:hypothetical protein
VPCRIAISGRSEFGGYARVLDARILYVRRATSADSASEVVRNPHASFDCTCLARASRLGAVGTRFAECRREGFTMARILASLAFVIFPSTLGCGWAVQPGLANAPALGGSTLAAPSVHDAIANGPDSCGRKLDPGPLRYRVVPCPRAGPSPTRLPPVASSPRPDVTMRAWADRNAGRFASWLTEPTGSAKPR